MQTGRVGACAGLNDGLGGIEQRLGVQGLILGHLVQQSRGLIPRQGAHSKAGAQRCGDRIAA